MHILKKDFSDAKNDCNVLELVWPIVSWEYIEKVIDAAAYLVYDRNHYFGLGLIPKPKPKLADTFGRYRNQYRNYISKGESSYR